MGVWDWWSKKKRRKSSAKAKEQVPVTPAPEVSIPEAASVVVSPSAVLESEPMAVEPFAEPEAGPEVATVVGVDVEDELDQKVDDYFDALFSGDVDPASLEEEEEEEEPSLPLPADHPQPHLEIAGAQTYTGSYEDFVRAEARELFASIAEQYVRPVTDFASELARGDASREWITICLPSIRMLLSSSRSMQLDDVVPLLSSFEEVLQDCEKTDAPVIGGAEREGLLREYRRISEVLPNVFEMPDVEQEVGEEEGEPQIAEGLLILSLLKQVPEVGRVTLDKLFAAGFTSLDVLFAANPPDIVRTANVSERVATKVCDKIREYQRERESERMVASGEYRIASWEKLADLVDRLEDHHKRFRQAAREWGAERWIETKRLHRRAREHVALRIEVVLLELGQAAVVEKLQRLPFDGRIKLLRECLDSRP